MSFRPEQLHVVSVINNPVRFHSRQHLFEAYVERMLATGVSLTVVEAALWDRDFAIRPVKGMRLVQVRQRDEVWLKECLTNRGILELPATAEYIAWIDGDVEFTRPGWAVETIQQLQHYHLVQMFQTAINLGPDGEALETFNGFGYSFAAGLPRCTLGEDVAYYAPTGKFWHPGFAWAANREVLDQLGGLLDIGILGSGDHHMALAMIGDAKRSIPGGMSHKYTEHVMRWQERCDDFVKRDLGYVPGTLLHHWHGRKTDRRYQSRWAILQKHHFDPDQDLKRDCEGIYILSKRGERMRNDLRAYFRSRLEDSIDLQ